MRYGRARRGACPQGGRHFSPAGETVARSTWRTRCSDDPVSAAPRELLISTKQDHTGVLVAVHDTGPGIHPEHLERVFKSFYTTKPRGTGMGLSICRSIVDAHGGRLWAEANEPRGGIFQFILPATQAGL